MTSVPCDTLISKDAQPTDTKGGESLQFCSPLYLALACGARHVIVGGGGGAKYGLKNGLVACLVDFERPRLIPQAAVDFGSDIAWCATALVDSGSHGPTVAKKCFASVATGAGAKTFLFAVSHIDAVSLVAAHVLASGSATLAVAARHHLISDDANPDKKPVAIASDGSLLVASQDDGSLAVFDVQALLVPSPTVAAKVKTSPTAKGKGGAKALIQLSVSCRVLDVTLLPVEGGAVAFVALCDDKAIRSGTIDVKTGQLKAPVTTLGVQRIAAPFPLMRSSFRVVRALGGAAREALIVIYDSSKGVAFSAVAAVAKSADAEVAIGEWQPMGREAATGVAFIASGTSKAAAGAVALLSTTDGGLVRLAWTGSASGARSATVRQAVHSNPMSAVAALTSPAGRTVAVTTDIAQRVAIAHIDAIFRRGAKSSTIALVAAAILLLLLVVATFLMPALNP